MITSKSIGCHTNSQPIPILFFLFCIVFKTNKKLKFLSALEGAGEGNIVGVFQLGAEG